MKEELNIEKDPTWERLQEKIVELSCVRSDLENVVYQISQKFPDKMSKQIVKCELEKMCNQLINHEGVIAYETDKNINGICYYDFYTKTEREETYYANVSINEKPEKEIFQVYVFDYAMGKEWCSSLKRKENGQWDHRYHHCFTQEQPTNTESKGKTYIKL